MAGNVPDAWDEEWSSVADTTPASSGSTESRKVSSKVSKAQRRAQQAEFNRQLWAEAEAPQETNYFLESRSVVPMRTEYKPPPVLLSRKGPPIVRSTKTPSDGVNHIDLNKKHESSEDEDEVKAREQTLAERQAQAAKDRVEKQRKYEERRQELFGTASHSANNNSRPINQSGTSTPNSLTPPGSRSAKPNRGRGRGRGRGGGMTIHSQARQQPRQQDLYDPNHIAKPDTTFNERREAAATLKQSEQQRPIRAPRGPDGSGRGGFGFTTRAERHATDLASDMAESVLGP